MSFNLILAALLTKKEKILVILFYEINAQESKALEIDTLIVEV